MKIPYQIWVFTTKNTTKNKWMMSMRNTGYWWNNYFWSTNQKTYFGLRPIWNTSIGWIDKIEYSFSEKQKCRLLVSLHMFSTNIVNDTGLKWRIWLTRWCALYPKWFSLLPFSRPHHQPLFVCFVVVCLARVVLERSAIESRKERARVYTDSLFRFS